MKIIIDADTGIDDALAIAYALGQKDAELIGITTSFGNVLVEDAFENTRNILSLLGREDIPVFKGAEHPWGTSEYQVSDLLHLVHGPKGLGKSQLPSSGARKETQPAVDFLTESARRYGKDLTLITMAPFTNLADAMKKDRTAIESIGDIVSMAGALTVQGNTNRFTECNINNDVLAAKYVYESGLHTRVVGLDVTLKTLLKGEDIKEWRKLGTIAGNTYCDFTSYYYRNEFGDEAIGGAMHDPLAVEAAVNPSIMTLTFPTNLTIETEGPSKGRMIADRTRLRDKEKTALVHLDVNADLFLTRFRTTVCQVLAEAR